MKLIQLNWIRFEWIQIKRSQMAWIQMTRTSLFFFGLFTLSRAFNPMCWAASETPNQRALGIAQGQKRVVGLLNQLKGIARSIQEPTFQNDALSILEQPVFRVIENHRVREKNIMESLVREKLIQINSRLGDSNSRPVSVFPTEKPMPFLAAPGSVWHGHHSYPGGLVYHTLTNARLSLHYAEVYEQIYNVQLRKDYLRFAAILHDAAKTLTLQWNSDGSCSAKEGQIAETSAHHLIAIAEAIERHYPIDFIVVLASAHSPPSAGQSLTQLIRFLKAGALIAEAPYLRAGLTSDGTSLLRSPPFEAFVNHLSDHDYVLTETSMLFVEKMLAGTRPSADLDYWNRNRILSETGDLILYQKALELN